MMNIEEVVNIEGIEEILDPPNRSIFDVHYVVAVAKNKGIIKWLILDHENLIFDEKKWQDSYVAGGIKSLNGKRCRN